MKKKEIKKLTQKQIIENLDKYKKDLFNFRFQKVNGQIKSPTKITETKRNIARLKNSKVLAFAGIGNPENFFNMLKNSGIIIEKKLFFS